LKIASKEIEETKYWLLLCERAEQYPNCVKLQEDLVEIAKILNKIISTTKLNIGND
jgi:four helix bundle protein